jgi:outer membrane receptor protein involved in Fe transport
VPSRWARLICQLLLWSHLSTVPAAAQSGLSGTVKDATGGAIANARILILTAQRAVVATTASDRDGTFAVPGLTDAEYLVIAQHPPFAERQMTITVAGGSVSIDIVLDRVTTSESVSVTATPGHVTALSKASQAVNVISELDGTSRARTVVAQAVEGEVGLALLRTSPGMAGIFVRGLTGNKVNVFVDGVRYSNGAQRGGVNTFLDLIDPSVVEGIEVLRGTSSALYGSDALGGSIQFLTPAPTLASGAPRRVGGTLTGGGETAHRGGFGAGTFNYAAARFGLLATVAGRKTGAFRPGGETTRIPPSLDSSACRRRCSSGSAWTAPASIRRPGRCGRTGFRCRTR